MQCVNAHWVSTPHLLLLRPSNSQLKVSIAQKRTQFPQTTPNHSDNNGDEIEGSAAAAVPLPYHVKSITSTSNPFVKHCVKLRISSSYRHEHGSVLVVGSTPIRSDSHSCLSSFELDFVFFLFLCFFVGTFPN